MRGLLTYKYKILGVIIITCIVGMIDKENDCVWIGGDSLGSNGYSKTTQLPSKVFKNKVFKNVVMGSTSTFRHIDLLKYTDTLLNEIDVYKDTKLDHEYMVTKFIPNLITLFKDGIMHESEANRGANFIIGTHNKLFEIQNDYSVLEPSLEFCSVGSGQDVAMGSLITTVDMDITIPKRIELALISAEKYCCGVQRPFTIINTKNDEIIVID